MGTGVAAGPLHRAEQIDFLAAAGGAAGIAVAGRDALIGEAVVGTLGTSNCHTVIKPRSGKAWHFKGGDPNPYSQEHIDLIASIRAGNPNNEARSVAESGCCGGQPEGATQLT